jgi:Heparinase II/III N-terminus/Heparinase II/III-like protein
MLFDRCMRWLRAEAVKLLRRLRPHVAMRCDPLRYRLGIGTRTRLRKSGAGWKPQFFFATDAVPMLCALWRQRLPEEAAAAVEQAEQICRYRFDLLGYENVFCGPEIDWQRDPVHGGQLPHKQPWFKLLRYLGRGDRKQVDCRIIWELNRHQHLVTLAKAYRLTGNGKYATEVFCQWRHWHAQNPYPMGVNWASSPEVSLRSLAWLWMYFLLADAPQLPPGFRTEWLQALSVNGRHIERYALEQAGADSRLLAEGVALFFIGTLCLELEAAERWKQKGWTIVLREAERHTVVDGETRGEHARLEQSTGEHVCALDLFLHACILASLNQMAVPTEFERVLEDMLEILSLLGRAGAPPRLGGSDGGRAFNSRRNRPEHLLDPLSTGAILFGRGDFKFLAGDLREETLWLLGASGAQEFDRLPRQPPRQGSAALPASGLYLMGGTEQQLVMDVRPENAIAASRGQAVALCMSLNRGGRALLIDPGLPGWDKNERARDRFRRALVHNTLLVESPDQREAGFAPGNHTPGLSVEGWISGHNFDLFAGSHDGYSRPGVSVVHRRWVFSRNTQFWLVRDQALGEGVQSLDLFWHLCPELSRYNGVSGMFAEANGGAGLRVLTVEGHGWSQEIRQGWWSPVYGRKEPLNVLHFSTVAELPLEFVTLLAPVPGAEACDGGKLTGIRQSPLRGMATGYRYENATEAHSLFFSPGKPWTLGRWSSDAEFLCWGASHDGERRVLICCNGSYVEMSGRRVISCPRKALRAEAEIRGEEMSFFSSDPDTEVFWQALDEPVAELAPVPGQPRTRSVRRVAGG